MDWEFFQTQLELLKSRHLAQRVVAKLNLTKDFNFRDKDHLALQLSCGASSPGLLRNFVPLPGVDDGARDGDERDGTHERGDRDET